MPVMGIVITQDDEAGAAGFTSESPKKTPQPGAVPVSASKRTQDGIGTQ